MIPVKIKQIKEIVNGNSYYIQDENSVIDAICTDSRMITKQSLFIALVGNHFDGHAFAVQSIKDGAIAVIVDHKLDKTIPQIVVKDTRLALGKIANFVRQQSAAKIVALTGSSGKTSVKEMTAAILQNCGQTLYTQGNFNNDIGVPLTMLRLTKQDQFAVIELGANHIGEIAYTTNIVKPDSALINNIAEAHIEGFGSLDGVAVAKGEIFEGLSKDGIAIINLDSCSDKWSTQLTNKIVWTFSLANLSADFYASNIQYAENTTFTLHTPNGECPIILPLIGEHNVSNAIAASALALSVGATFNQIQQGLATLKPVKGRLFPIRLNQTQLIWDDSYNANVGSMSAAIKVLAKQPGYRVLVVGDMGELGPESEKYHRQIGELARDEKLDCVVSIGKLSQFISQYSGEGHHFNNKQDAANFLLTLLRQHPTLTMLVKGSRSAKMEEIIEKIQIKQ
ncbi:MULTISPECIES: UDP-N-acetylmuramoyl-tripeptide--D-alanyl-D-alanine ligase [unclassified Gilliamella]|uniref:UDP-N-acetylmuramoyl-tripeptide--D-alanyl-D- alanine ligase n=1 Tax=unclassified Gilliamella TaxID=2685620 RepID=UPI00130840B1|nr:MULTISPECIES: UDP-N-acetylmuramoyl-tripeptide--D-alanyl-D-alanine ligase [unclassified Gilliamella]MWP48379.1 UDP-N-acetylmuramoyl-tripeptide--D-alanyl-D-alanine ligase [Gilliamella sp. Lep-s35]MWP68342.1 UDP-N-acetylmuramoyl-tripeptide--D-alanyl-D-alanine ligase [Gilliamella sp. Lep-s5]MWP76519.1 UDP-N-acetylmuramoyl-tripeptide--D-alanyl-D-alanine ligase [Gilliamella sp. Lep-s21]